MIDLIKATYGQLMCFRSDDMGHAILRHDLRQTAKYPHDRTITGGIGHGSKSIKNRSYQNGR